MDALTDDSGNGFVRFDPADTDRLADCCREFSELAGRLKEREIASESTSLRRLMRVRSKGFGRLGTFPTFRSNVRGGPTLGRWRMKPRLLLHERPVSRRASPTG